MAVPVIELSIIGGFFALMLGIGFYHYFTHDWEGEYGYFVGGGKLGPIISGFTYLATIFSMFSFLGAVGGYWGLGISFLNLPLFEGFIVAILMPTLGYKFWRVSKRYQHVTPSDMMAKRYNESDLVRVIVAIVMLVSMIIYLTVQYIGVGLVLELVTDGFLSFNTVVGLMFVVGGIYVAIGGMRSVAITDTIQGILLTLGMILIFGAIFYFFDPTTMSQNILETNPAVLGVTSGLFSQGWLAWVTQGLAFAFGFFLWPQLWIRYYAPDSRRSLGIMAFMFVIFMFALWFIFAYFITWSAPTTLAEIPSNPDMIAVNFTLEYLPTWLAAVILTGGAAAALSTLDSTALVLGSITSHDIIEKSVLGDMSESMREQLSRSFAFILMLVGALLVWFGPQGTIASLLISFTYPAMAALFPAVLISMYWRNAGKWATVISMVGGAGYVFGTWVGVLPTPMGLYSGAWGMAIGLVLMVGISLVEGFEPEEEIVEEYGLYHLGDGGGTTSERSSPADD